MNKLNLQNITVGQKLEGVLGVIKSEIKVAKNGPYLMMTLTDGTSEIAAKIWQYNIDIIPTVGTAIAIKGTVGEYNNVKDLNIAGWAEQEFFAAHEFMKCGHNRAEDLHLEIIDMLIPYEDIWYVKMTLDILDRYKSELLVASGAKSVHHDYIGGLLQHIYEVMLFTEQQVNIMTLSIAGVERKHNISMPMALCGACLHDIGKIEAYKRNGFAFEMTNTGMLLDHISAGVLMIQRFIDAHSDEVSTIVQDRDELEHLLHIVLAHHGNKEWGSPVVPVSPEAMIVHIADMSSSKLEIFIQAQNASITEWTPKNFYAGTQVYNPQ